MRTLLFTLFTILSIGVYSQSYVSYEMPNNGKIIDQEMVFEKGDSMIVLVNNSTSPPNVYVLENMTTPSYIAPVLDPDWTTTILYKQHKTFYHFDIGANYRVVNDNNGYSYIQIH